MNIYILDEDPVLAAQYHCDQHVYQAFKDLCVILSSVHHQSPHPKNYNFIHTGLLKSLDTYNKNVSWVKQSLWNYIWCVLMADGLYELCDNKINNKYLFAYKILKGYLPWLPTCKTQSSFVIKLPNKFKVPIINSDKSIPKFVIDIQGNLVSRNGDEIHDNFYDPVASYRKFYATKLPANPTWRSNIVLPIEFTHK